MAALFSKPDIPPPPAPPPPPANPPTAASSTIQADGAQQRSRLAAAAGMGYGDTLKTGPQGAPITPGQLGTKSLLGD